MKKPVLLIGGSGDIGAETIRLLLAAGDGVIATARNAAQCNDIKARFPAVQAVFPLDLASAETVLQTLNERLAEDDIGGVIVCAATSGHGPLETVPLAAVRAALEANSLACLAVYQACMPALRRQRGSLVLVSSISGRIALPFLGGYQASKFALEAMADVMRLEGSLSGVRVVLIEPGGVNTKLVSNAIDSVRHELSHLSEPALGLYGDLYRNFITMSEGADWSLMSSAAHVAEVIVSAYRHPDPEPRYIVGADAEWFLTERKVRSDRAMDALAMKIYGITPLA